MKKVWLTATLLALLISVAVAASQQPASELFDSALQTPLLITRDNEWSARNKCGTVYFRREYFEFSTISVLAVVYWRKFLTEARAMNWEVILKLAILPFLGMLLVLRNRLRHLYQMIH